MKLTARQLPLVHKIKILLVISCWRLYNLLIFSTQSILFRKNKRPEKILVFRTGSIGDSICAMPAMSHLRTHFRSANIHLLTNAGKGRRNLVSMEALIQPGIFNAIINYESLSRSELTRRLRDERYDMVIHLTQYNVPFMRLLRDMVYFRFIAGIKCGFGWQHSRIMFFRKTQEKYLLYTDERKRLNDILQKNGVPTQGPDIFPFQIEENDHLKVAQLLASIPSSGRPAIAIVAGAKRPQNRWPVSHFEAVIRFFCNDFNIFLIGGPEDAALILPLLYLPNVHSFCGLLSPIQSGLLMQHCNLVLTNDTGPMHLAYAFGVPVVAVFSNRDFPGRWYPPAGGQNAVLRATGVSCSLCLSETCGNNICMQKITPGMVIEEMNALLFRSIIPVPAT